MHGAVRLHVQFHHSALKQFWFYSHMLKLSRFFCQILKDVEQVRLVTFFLAISEAPINLHFEYA